MACSPTLCNSAIRAGKGSVHREAGEASALRNVNMAGNAEDGAGIRIEAAALCPGGGVNEAIVLCYRCSARSPFDRLLEWSCAW